MRNITINQKTINLIIIAGVAVMATGAWVMPMYNAQLAHDDAVAILGKVKEVKTDTGGLDKGLTGGKDLGKTNLVALLTADKDKSTLSKILGDDFTDFQSSFLGTQKKSDSSSAGIDVKTFSAPEIITLVPDNFSGIDIAESAVTDCKTNGKALSTALSSESLDSTKIPLGIKGFAVKNTEADDQDIRIKICTTGSGELGSRIIVDELVHIKAGQIFTKNFDYGVVPPNSALKVFVGDNDSGNNTHDFWIIVSKPDSEIQISTFSGLSAGGGGGSGVSPCNSIEVEVHKVSGGSTSAVGSGEAIVEISHSFIPVFAEGQTDSNGKVTFNGPLPPGDYFIDVFPTGESAFPTFAEKSCSGGTELDLTGSNKLTLGSASSFTSSTKGNLEVFVTNQNGVPVEDTTNFVDHTTLPIINDICNNNASGASDCEEIDSELIQVGTLTDGVATYKLTDIPTGTWFIESCTDDFECGFAQASVSDGKTTTVTVEIIVTGGS